MYGSSNTYGHSPSHMPFGPVCTVTNIPWRLDCLPLKWQTARAVHVKYTFVCDRPVFLCLVATHTYIKTTHTATLISLSPSFCHINLFLVTRQMYGTGLTKVTKFKSYQYYLLYVIDILIINITSKGQILTGSLL